MPACHNCKRKPRSYCWKTCKGPAEYGNPTADNRTQLRLAAYNDETAYQQVSQPENTMQRNDFIDPLIDFATAWLDLTNKQQKTLMQCLKHNPDYLLQPGTSQRNARRRIRDLLRTSAKKSAKIARIGRITAIYEGHAHES